MAVNTSERTVIGKFKAVPRKQLTKNSIKDENNTCVGEPEKSISQIESSRNQDSSMNVSRVTDVG